MDDKNTRRNSNSQYKEVEKYIKFFVLKSLQAVVLSRAGVRNKTKCFPAAKGQDWFNISLPDGEANRSLQIKIRELFGKRIPSLNCPICLDVVLKTFEGSYIVLETWQLSTDVNCKESNHKNHFSIYNRLGVLIKSIISVSRVLPSFNLSRKSEKDFSLYFKIHTELYSLHRYELHNSILIGTINTPIGKLNTKVMYRNKIWLSGSIHHAHTYTISDPETLLPLSSSEKESGKAAFQSIDMFENELALAVSDTGFNQEWFASSTSSVSPKIIQSPPPTMKNVSRIGDEIFSGATVGHEDGLRPVAAFVEPLPVEDFSLNSLDLPKLPPTPPFQSLLQERVDRDRGKSQIEDKNPSKEKLLNKESNRQEKNPLGPRHAEAVGFEDDFVLVELRPAFFSEDDSVGNLYRQCQSPTPLEIFSSLEHEDKESESIDLDTQLERYQKELQEYKEFFSSLQ